MRRIVWLSLGTIVTVLGAGSIGYVYNYHLAPLARLASGIEEGDSFGAVYEKCIAYYEQGRGMGSVSMTARDSATGQWTTDLTVAADGLHVSDTGLFDDIDLTVEFDGKGRVKEKRLIGD